MPPKGSVNSPQVREKLREAWKARRLRPISLETRRKTSESLRKYYAEHPEERAKLGRHNHSHSAATIEKMRQAARRRGLNPAYRERMRQAKLNPSPETREKMRQARLRRTFPTRMTSIEQALYREFTRRRLKFEMHKTMFGRWQPDFVFESVMLIVQADGDYWHRQRPGMLERDACFNEEARAAEWTVWRFAESEIKMHPDICGKAVARFVRLKTMHSQTSAQE